jgi:hypothetical protein
LWFLAGFLTGFLSPMSAIKGSNPAGIVLQAFGCRGLVLLNMVIQGGSIGLMVNQASEAVIQNVVAKNNTADGIVAQIDSTLGVAAPRIHCDPGSGSNTAVSLWMGLQSREIRGPGLWLGKAARSTY